MKKVLSVFLVLCMLFSAAIPAFAAEQTTFTIKNPYEKVDWDQWETYKANLHTHTNASDGDPTITEMVQAYYDKGYDILAITDHGVITNGWNNPVKTNGIFNGFRKVSPMSEGDYTRFTTGSDRDGRHITDITGGIECNMAVVSKTHVNGYFTTYGQGVWGKENDYETAPKQIEKAGGYSVLNHVGDWVNSNNFPERSDWNVFIAYFAKIFTSYKTCLGMEIVNNTDNVTRADRILWDNLLQVVIPTGRNIWAFADDDSEQLDEVGRSFELFPLEENNEANVKQAMIDGAFFAASRYCKPVDKNLPGFEGDGNVPLVKKITVDEAAGTIAVKTDESRDCTSFEWISDGKVISTEKVLDLNAVKDELGCYVRFQMKGSGGVTYSQPFELSFEGPEVKSIPTDALKPFDNLFGKLFLAFYRSLFFALNALIIEKIADWTGII